MMKFFKRIFGRNVSDKKKHEYRHFLQHTLIPEIVAAVGNHELSPENLLDTSSWEKIMGECFGRKDYFEWNELSCKKIKVNEGLFIILYTFPEPKLPPEALYGAVVLDTIADSATYYTLERSFGDSWVIGCYSGARRMNFGALSNPDEKKFVCWVVECECR